MFSLVVELHWSDIGNLYWEQLKRHVRCRILRKRVNGVWMIFSFASWVIYVLIGCRAPFIRYWQPLLGTTTARCSLPHLENEGQRSVNRVSTIFAFACSVIYVPIGSRHPFIRYWQPLLGKTTVTCSLPHPENERHRSVNSFSCCIFRNQGIAHIFAFITDLLSVPIRKNTI